MCVCVVCVASAPVPLVPPLPTCVLTLPTHTQRVPLFDFFLRPVFLFDGASNSTVSQAGPNELTLSAPAGMGGGGVVSLRLLPTGAPITLHPPGPGDTTPTRNGVLGVALAETQFSTQAPSMTLVVGFQAL